MTNLFAYGSLMCEDILFAVISCRPAGSNALLNDYYRSKIHNEEYPAIIPQSKARVDGVLYPDLPGAAIEKLDVFEGAYYDRQDVQVFSEKCGEMEAMAYVLKPQYYQLLTYTEWSYAHFLAAGRQKFERAYLGFRDILE